MRTKRAVDTRVFISYSRKDQAVAERLRRRLTVPRELNIEAYLDTHDIAKGEPWRERLEGLIECADVVVFLISPDSVTSELCDWEVNEADLLEKRIAFVVCRETPLEAIPARLNRPNFTFLDTPESEIAEFPKLLSALAEDAEWIREHTRLRELALLWDRADRPSRLLLWGADIDAAETWRADRTAYAPELTPLHNAVLTQSRRGATRRQRWWIGGVATVSAVTTALAVFALFQREVAPAEADRALNQESRAFAALANAATESGDAVTGSILALLGLPNFVGSALTHRQSNGEALNSLWRALWARREAAIFRGHAKEVNAASFSPDGRQFVTASDDGTARLWNADSGSEIAVLRGHNSRIRTALFRFKTHQPIDVYHRP